MDEARTIFAFGDFELDESRRELRRNGALVDLQPKPVQLLAHLVRNHDRAVPKQELFEQVWPDVSVSDAALSSALRDVRRALHDDGTTQAWISTERGRGFRFVAPVEQRPSSHGQLAPRRHQLRYRAAIALALVLAGVSVWGLLQPAPDVSSLRSIAVLPFVEISAAGGQEYLADGMTEELSSELSKVEGLRVVARTSAFAFKGTNEDVRSIGAQLGVGAIVEGSVRSEGGRIRVTAQLIRVEDGFHLWSESYERDLGDVFAIQREISRSILDALQVELLEPHELRREPPTQSLEAYELYVTGRFLWSRFSKPDLERSVDYFQRALAIDPEFALAWAGHADASLDQWDGGFERRDDVYEAAAAAAHRALELDPDLAEAHAVASYLAMLELDWDTAEREAARALEINPSLSVAWLNLGVVHMEQGRVDEALAAMERCLRIDPLSGIAHLTAGRFYFFAGRTGEAMAHLGRARDLSPESAAALWWLAVIQAIEGDEDAATRAYLLRFEPPASSAALHDGERVAFREGFSAGGFQEGVRSALEWRIRETGMPCTGDSPNTATLLAWLGETERMYVCLEESIRERAWPAYALVNPLFASQHSERRFRNMLESQGLPRTLAVAQ